MQLLVGHITQPLAGFLIAELVAIVEIFGASAIKRAATETR
jgi:hypothetical protein